MEVKIVFQSFGCYKFMILKGLYMPMLEKIGQVGRPLKNARFVKLKILSVVLFQDQVHIQPISPSCNLVANTTFQPFSRSSNSNTSFLFKENLGQILLHGASLTLVYNLLSLKHH
ncbi:unnamed protein product [Vicia faba]|uniref:Uncharacterized protein n=1 Tax=Vicia faba TaxID=3906 RepID=A0AAV1AF53_VICFA|nr:unnamed protein product [Vicia faba]